MPRPDLVARPVVFTAEHVRAIAPNIDLMPVARAGRWITGQLASDGHSVIDEQTVAFGGDAGDPRGHVREEVVALEDGSSVSALRTHPRWLGKGTIKGFMGPITLPSGAMFRADVGFLAGVGETDGVRFQVWVKSDAIGTRVADLVKRSDGKLVTLTADLSWLAGRSVELELRVDARDSSTQDWAVWTRPHIEVRDGAAAMIRRFRVESLTIDRISGTGDFNDPGLLMLHFRSVMGQRGSSKVSLVEMVSLGNDLGVGREVQVDLEKGLFVDDPGVVWPVGDTTKLASGERDSLYIAGVAIAAIDRDGFGTSEANDALRSRGTKLLTALREHVETLRVKDLSTNPGLIDQAFAAVRDAVGGGGSFIGSIKSFLADVFTAGRPHDLVGTDASAFIGMESGIVPISSEVGRVIKELPLRTEYHFRIHGKSPVSTARFGGLPPADIDVRWRAIVVVEVPQTAPVLGPGIAGS